MLDVHARRGFPDWLTVAATCRAVVKLLFADYYVQKTKLEALLAA